MFVQVDMLVQVVMLVQVDMLVQDDTGCSNKHENSVTNSISSF